MKKLPTKDVSAKEGFMKDFFAEKWCVEKLSVKNWSIKWKVTLWYTLFMIILTVLILGFLLFLSDQQIIASVQSRLETVVSDSLEEIDYDEEDGLDIDEDMNFFQDGVYLVLYDEQGNYIRGQLPSRLETAQTPVFQNGQIQTVTVQSVKWLFLDVYDPLHGDSGIWVRGVISQSEAASGLNIILRFFMILLPLFVILVAIGGYYITDRAFRPVKQMRETAEEISGGQDLSRRIQLGRGKDEIHQLADTFDGMLDRIQASFEREKQFTSDASHELRTPTSVILTQAEYALRRGEPSKELRESLQIILTQSRKMSGMISQLLMLVRADQGRAKLQRERVHLSELVEIIAEEEQERADSRNIVIEADCQTGLYMVGDETMLMRVFINLIENAITYGKEDGHIWIGLSRKKASDGNHVNHGSHVNYGSHVDHGAYVIRGYIKDDGIGIQEEHLTKIWERFYQVDPSRSVSSDGNSGLGLAMVKWIVEAHGGGITAESVWGEGSVFSFWFPEE